MSEAQRRLTTIVAADIAGFSRHIGIDEEGTLAAQRGHRAELIEPLLAEHLGRIANTAGDSFLFEFPSVVEAMRFAMAVQDGMAARNGDVPAERRIEYRIGINVGDVVADGDDLLGDGVNVAARLENLAEPGGICISRAARDQVRDRMNIALKDMGEVEVKNIARPVRVFRVLGQGEHAATPTAEPTAQNLPLPDKPSIAVLPFDNMSGVPEQEYFADGMAEDLITDLSKISNLYVAARNSSFSFKGQMRDVREVAENLGVSFVLEGSVRKMGQRLRINAQLVKAADGGHIWAERYDGDMDEIFEFQDRIRGEIIAALELQLSASDNERSQRRRTNSVEAYDLFLKGRSSYFQYTPESHVAAREFLEQAIQIDPQFADAHSYLSYCVLTSRLFMWSERGDELERSIALAEKGAALDPKSAIVWTRLAWAHGWAGNFDKAVKFYEEALALEPDNAEVYAYYAETLNFTEQAEKAVELLHRALEIETLSPPSWDFMLGHSLYELGQSEEAVPRILRCIDRAPMFAAAHLYLACTYVELGRLDEAEEQIRVLRDIEPRYTADKVRERYKYSDETNCSRFLENLRKAGLPE